MKEDRLSQQQIHHAEEETSLHVPVENLAFDVGPCHAPALPDPGASLHRALAHPIGAPPLSELVRPGQKVVLIVDDNTRLTPTRQIVPVVLDALNRAGIPDGDVRAVIASGTHRPMTAPEKVDKYGEEVLARIPVLDHRYRDPDRLVDYGRTRRGTRILVNRDVIAADVRIAIGNIIPHHPAGWSGGAKAVLPGVAGEETVAQMHLLGCRQPSLGGLDTPMRQEMEDLAASIGLSLILNVVLNHAGLLVGAVAGHFVQAHRAGVEIARRVYCVPIPERADLVISIPSPVDGDLFQADKGLTAAEPATRAGGEVVLVAGCREGISPAHPELADYLGRMSNPQIWELLRQNRVPDPLTAAEAIVLNDLKARLRITLATAGLAPELCRALGFRHVRPQELGEYVRQRLAEAPGLRIGILRHSAELSPVVGAE
ncbi:MAG: nickel-dependent lactate racemase [Anaerolineae bacterium]|nr:nickel-dependent lactate racemase [Anaerolineae bacterium]